MRKRSKDAARRCARQEALPTRLPKRHGRKSSAPWSARWTAERSSKDRKNTSASPRPRGCRATTIEDCGRENGMINWNRKAAALLAAWALALPAAQSHAQVETDRPPVVAGAEPVRIDAIKVHAPTVAGNLEGNAADREVYVVLPPSYDAQPDRRYPVVYALHGYFIGASQWMKEIHMPQTAEGAFAQGVPEMIIVLPDSKTRHLGSLYASSPTVGDFENFIAGDLIEYIDSHYRTIARPESRGLVGHSMGGYGAARIGIKHAEKFGALYI